MDVRFIVSVDSTGAVKSIQAFDGSLQTLGKTAKTHNSEFARIWQGFTVGALAASAVHRGISEVRQAIADVIQTGRSFERAWANTTTMLSTSAKETAKMKAELIAMSPHLGKVTELAQGMYQVLSASIEPSKAIEFLGIAAKSAKAGITQAEVAVDALTTVINAYGMEAEDATKVSDIMFQSVKLGKLTYEQMAGALGTVVPIASQVGLSFEEIAAAMSTLTRKGVDANTTTVQLRQIMVSVLKPTKEAADLAKLLGIEFNAQALKAKGLSQFLQDVTAKTGGNADAMTVLFGNVRALTGVMGLAGSAAQDFKNDLEAMKGASGATEEAFKKQMDSLDFWIDSFNNSMERMKISFYEGFVTPIKDAIQSADDLEGMMKDLQNVANGLGTMLGTTVLPVLNTMLQKFKVWADTLKVLPVYIDMLQQAARGEGMSMDRAIDKYILAQISMDKLKKSTDDTKDSILGITGAIDRGALYYATQAAAILETATTSEEASRQLDQLAKFMGTGASETGKMGGKVSDLKKELELVMRADVETRLIKLNQALLTYGGKMTADQVKKIYEEIGSLEKQLKGLTVAAPKLEDAISLALGGLENTTDDVAAAIADLFKDGFDDIKKEGEQVLKDDLPAWIRALPNWTVKSTKKMTDAIDKFGGAARDVIGMLDSIISQSYSNQAIELDNFYQGQLEKTKETAKQKEAILDQEYETEKARIEDSLLSEAEKAELLKALDAEYAASKTELATTTNAAIDATEAEYTMKSRELKKKQAEAGKVTAIAAAIINVAEGVSKAIAQGGIFGAIFGAIVLALGAIQIAKIKSTPIPLKEGAIFREPAMLTSRGGNTYEVAEAGEAEILTTGRKIREAIFGRDTGLGSGRQRPIEVHVYLDNREIRKHTTKTIQKEGSLGHLGPVGRALANE